MKIINNKYYCDFVLILYILILLIIKLLLISNNSSKYLYKSIISIFISLSVMFIFSKINYRFYEKVSYIFYIISLILIILNIFIGKNCKGSYRWINLYFFNFQVSEIFKISIPMLISSISYRNKDINSIKLILLSIFIIFLPSLIILFQPNLGTSILIILSGFFTLFFSGINFINILFINFILFIFILIYYNFFIKDYQKNRILTLLNNKNKLNYHINQSKIAIGSGGIFGKGLFNGTQSRLNFLPESHTDFIFSVLAEEFGLFGVIILLSIYLLIIIKCLKLALNSNNIFNKVLISSFISSIFFSIFINIGMVIGILPIVGIPLPIISYGGSSLFITLIKIGIILSIKNNNENLYF
ncbi:rod shape-determining protein RodA [endosymbiont of Pachyrhynchus infernalis]|uniref:rod shape-determining protein RodA n=1 Tax=endosymbiont of Pachyrhynchus infernalis TaxID=1971488 RepID=UPI000DC6F2C4|nr:rod shape-determining protein RodA [endosymbiont of Pachyrhynchus infernalis]BBA84930.1 putative rod shape-determining protein RodA [endosymbiont of Pachyrhynchus infernalis]